MRQNPMDTMRCNALDPELRPAIQNTYQEIRRTLAGDPLNLPLRARAVRYLLVQCFGTEDDFHNDPEFNAQVKLAEQLIVGLPC